MNQLSPEEFKSINTYIENGGTFLVLSTEGSQQERPSNLYGFLKRYGIIVNNDAVVRTVYYKYLHPKEVYIANGLVFPSMAKDIKKRKNENNKSVDEDSDSSDDENNENFDKSGLTIVYPYGATLTIKRNVIPILSTGYISYPINVPIVAVHELVGSGGKYGRLCVCGSHALFSDNWIGKEENQFFEDYLLDILTSSVGVRRIISKDHNPEVSEHQVVPDITNLAERLKSCLQESDRIPYDFTQLFDVKPFQFDSTLIPESISLYDKLDIKHDQLSLIQPQFECPLPPLQPAVFDPILRELPPPELDQYDLDEQFASTDKRLAQLTNKCTDDDLDYYIRECGKILDIPNDYIKKSSMCIFYFIY